MAEADVIDLRSDFLAHPTEGMLDAYRASAKCGAYGLREDSRQRELEARIARLLGCEDALLFPTCTMANLTAVFLHTAPGDTLVCPEAGHVLTSEADGAGALAGVAIKTVPGQAVEAPIERWLETARPADDAARSNPALCWLENTHNRLGGAALSAGYCHELATALRAERTVRLHLDGSRILYAAAALGSDPAALAAPFDTVSISLNKGLGSPVAAALAGPRATIARAEHVRQRLGGGIRPVAAACAAALVALEDLSHLRDDIRRAKSFAERLRAAPDLDFSALPVVSNLVFFGLDEARLSTSKFIDACANAGLLLNAPSPGRLRAVFYRGIGDEDLERAATVIEGVLGRHQAAPSR